MRLKKPNFLSHYLVLSDLIRGEDVRQKSDTIFYFTSRIENIKLDLVKHGVEFIEDATKETAFSFYKPYLLKPSKENLERAQKLLERYETLEVLEFLESQKRTRKSA